MNQSSKVYYFLIAILIFSCEKKEKVPNEILTEQAPNIVFILSDDQAWTDYSFMGHEHVATPYIDRLAREGLTFTRGYVPTSLCSPSLASIITGLYPKQHLVLGNDRKYDKADDREEARKNRSKEFLPVIENFKTLTTLPELLKDKDYLSFQTGKWWQGNFTNGGFDYGMTHGDPNRGGRHGDAGLTIGREGMDTIYNYIDLAVEEEKPFFLWYAPFLPHSPHTPPDSLLQKYLPVAPTEYVAKYWAMCEWFDITCGQLSAYIEKKGLMENTLFVYVCDNGWVQNLNNRSYNKNSKRSPFDYGMRTPIIFKWKGKIEPKMDTTTLVSSIDLVPTVLDILDISKPENLQGVSVLNQNTLNNREAIFGEIYAHDFSTIDASLFYKVAYTNPYKLIVPDSKNKSEEEVQLFNIYEDPFEANNLVNVKPEVVKVLREKLEQQWANFD